MPEEQPSASRLANGAALLIAIVVFAVNGTLTQVYVEGWDPVAYLYAAERILEGDLPAFCHPYNGAIGPYFTLAGFNVRSAEQDCLYLNYPLGYPVLLAFAAKLAPFHNAMLYVSAFLGAVGTLLVYLLGLMLFDVRTGLTASILLGFAPLYLHFATSSWSDLPVAVILLASAVTMVWADRQSSVIGQIVGGIVAALAIGWAVFSRYSAGVFLVPLALYVLAGKSWLSILKSPSILAFAVTVAGCFVGIGLFNRSFYGSFLTTAYSAQHGWYSWPMFSFSYALGQSPVGAASLIAAVRTLWNTYGFLWLFGCAGVIAARRRSTGLLVMGSTCFVALYALYAFPATGINERFLLPSLPFAALVIACGVWQVRYVGGMWMGVWRRFAVFAIITWFCLILPGALDDIVARNCTAETYVRSIRSITSETASNSVFLAYHTNDAISYYGGRVSLFYRRIVPASGSEVSGAEYFESHLVTAVSALLERGTPVYYMLDTDPPFMNSLATLRAHFAVVPSSTHTSLYQIERLP